MNRFYIGVVLAAFIACAFANPKKYVSGDDDNSSFQPSTVRYYEPNYSLNSRNSNVSEPKETSAINRYQRFGHLGLLPPSNYGNTGSGVQGYTPGGVSYSTPMKIDIGGVALGALIGLSAVLIAPKIFSVFHTLAPGYRSLDSTNSSVITDILARVDNSLEQHNIDSSSCMQRIICSYVNEAQKNINNGEQNTVDEMVYAISNNPLLSYMLDGSAMKQAIDMGKQGDVEKCASLYVKCPVSRDNVMQVISSLLPS
ncbi:hypothetical protein RN001_000751 [Aquatica leii]|uniref:Uncharacterized protein n=1 Tax=Aquatica leii TaxID=1421715 RepID=A0AAN7Q9X0_9COLE|nr:hypothetical protein RN001_000751 [Aquatica leii]